LMPIALSSATTNQCFARHTLFVLSTMLVFSQARTILHALVLVTVLAPEAVPVLLSQVLDDFVESFRDGKCFILFELGVILVQVLDFARQRLSIVGVFFCVLLVP
jgi:hypothetical protein